MTLTPALRKLLAGFLLLAGSVTQALAQTPSPALLLDPKLAPKFEDANIPVPTADELKACTVELVRGDVPKSSGWLLKDPKGQPMRRFFDSTGTGKVDMWSYFKDGVEVYREFDTTGKGAPNNFRWLNSGGMKWGVGAFDAKAGHWVIHTWKMISAEEVGFEAFQAVAKANYARLQALFITDAEMQAMKLPESKGRAIAALQQQAPDKFAAVVKSIKGAGAIFDSVEASIPQCDTTHGGVEIIRHPSRAVRFAVNNKHGWIHTGEMIKINAMAWRLVESPSEKESGGPIAQPLANNPQLEKLLGALATLDQKYEKLPSVSPGSNHNDIETYYRQRIELVKQILPLDKASEHESWYRQLFDNLTAQAQNSFDKKTIALLTQFKDDIVKAKPGSNLAAYGVYREMWTRFNINTANEKDQKAVEKYTNQWLEDLAAFVEKYPKSDDAIESWIQIATGNEFGGKIEKAKTAYKAFCDLYANHPMMPRMRGALDRLNLVGNEMKLALPTLDDPKTTFDIAKLKGKLVIVHYWATAGSSHEDDFARLKRIVESAKKGSVELVCIALDDDANKARQAVARARVPGVHLFGSSNNANGTNGPAATQYGIHILPTLFMVGRDGRVVNNALQIADIDTELKRLEK